MNRGQSRFSPVLLLAAALTITSCAAVSKRMPESINQMDDFLSKRNPGQCGLYHYNFERQAPRLYSESQIDSIHAAIDYIKTQCGPAPNIETTRLLLLMNQRKFDDTLIGSYTIPQMLWYRSEKEIVFRWRRWTDVYGPGSYSDNTHEKFLQFRTKLAESVVADTTLPASARAIGLTYEGEFDSSFSFIQSKEMRNSKLRESYDEYVSRVKRLFPARGNIAVFSGSWRPQGNNKFLGNHPEIGIQFGGETKSLRFDGVISYRFSSAKDSFLVDSLGQIVPTNTFNSWLFGVEAGYKFLDFHKFSSDIFVGLGYDVIFSVTKAGDPETLKSHGSLGASVGLRQRVFLNEQNGWYVGAIVRYCIVDYNNPRGTDLSGNTLSISLVTGWSLHETLYQFLRKLNYKGNWRR